MIKKASIISSILLFAILSFSTAQETSLVLSSSPNPLIDLEKNYAYAGFDANSEYLTWFEYYKSELFIYDRSHEEIRKINFKKGRGPGEYTAITDVSIFGKKIYLLDPKNNKLLKVDVKSGEKEDLPFRSDRPYRLVNSAGEFYLLENVKPDKLISLYKPESQKATYFDNGDLNIQQEFQNPFFRDGVLLGSKDKIYFVTKYRPLIYTYNKEAKEFGTKIEFDDSDVKTTPATEMSSGAKAFHPPTEVDVLTEDAVNLRKLPNSIFILAKGVTDNRQYQLNNLYQFDLNKREFIATHDLRVKATNVFTDGDCLFVFTEEKSNIYRFEIKSAN